jgi:hypothetical protein
MVTIPDSQVRVGFFPFLFASSLEFATQMTGLLAKPFPFLVSSSENEII